jgi:hypothetical protein
MYLHRQAQVVNWILYAFCLELVSSQLIYAFVGLDASSLWIDELWTGWLVLPSDGPESWPDLLRTYIRPYTI